MAKVMSFTKRQLLKTNTRVNGWAFISDSKNIALEEPPEESDYCMKWHISSTDTTISALADVAAEKFMGYKTSPPARKEAFQ